MHLELCAEGRTVTLWRSFLHERIIDRTESEG